MIPAGWTIDCVHPCGSMRLVNAQGHVTTYAPKERIVHCGDCKAYNASEGALPHLRCACGSQDIREGYPA